MRSRSAIALCVLAALALSGCTDADVPQPVNSATVSETATATAPATARHVEELYGPDAIPLSEYVTLYPEYAPTELRGGAFLLEQASTASREFPVPAAAAGVDSLVLAIFCDKESPYELAVKRASKVLDRTWGQRCPQSGIVLYTTAPLPGSLDDLTFQITVNDATPYRVAVVAAKGSTE